jgi:molybdate transport system substrate-binding protein
MRTSIIWLLLAGTLLTGCTTHPSSGADGGESIELIISAAASLTNSLLEIQTIYEKENDSVRLVYNFGGSGALQQQIERGAPADLFLSAGQAQMNALVDQGYIRDGTAIPLLTNELVAIVKKDAAALPLADGKDLLTDAVRVIAIGEPNTVPAGNYARAALTHEGVWGRLRTKMVFAKNVRQVLHYVETGNAEVGFVYRTDALPSDKVSVGYAVDPSSYPPIAYPAGIVKTAKHPKEAERFLAFLQSETARDVFDKHGFGVPEAAP